MCYLDSRGHSHRMVWVLILDSHDNYNLLLLTIFYFIQTNSQIRLKYNVASIKAMDEWRGCVSFGKTHFNVLLFLPVAAYFLIIICIRHSLEMFLVLVMHFCTDKCLV